MPDPVGGSRPPQWGQLRTIPVGPLPTMTPAQRERALRAADHVPMRGRESRVPSEMRRAPESSTQFRRGDPSSDLRRGTDGRPRPGLEIQGYRIERQRGRTPLEDRREIVPNIVRTR